MKTYGGVKAFTLHSFIISSLDRSEDQLHARSALPPEKKPAVHSRQEAGWLSETFWTLRRRENPLSPGRNRHPNSSDVHVVVVTKPIKLSRVL
jgi:hypothetical protein